MQHKLFVYGTLMSPKIIRQLLGRVPEGAPAWLADYQAYCVQNAWYPGAIPEPGATLQGWLYRGIKASEMTWLDDYEGEYYHRIRCTVHVENNAENSWLYPFKPSVSHRLSKTLWTHDHLRQAEVGRFGG